MGERRRETWGFASCVKDDAGAGTTAADASARRVNSEVEVRLVPFRPGAARAVPHPPATTLENERTPERRLHHPRFSCRIRDGRAHAPRVGGVRLSRPQRSGVRLQAHAAQEWLPSRHEGPNLALYGMLMYAGTDKEVRPDARWQPPELAVGINREFAAGPDEIEHILSLTSSEIEPADEDMLLADARSALSIVRVRQQWKMERRDTGRAVLLAGMAAEVKIKRTLTAKVRTELRPLLDFILENPRDMSVATSQLLDKPLKAALGISLREEKRNLPDEYKTLWKDVTETLFLRRNRVAHLGWQPPLDEAKEAVEIAGRLFAWLDTVPGAPDHGADSN